MESFIFRPFAWTVQFKIHDVDVLLRESGLFRICTFVISRTVSSKFEKNFIGAVELNISVFPPPLQADLALEEDLRGAAPPDFAGFVL